MHFFIDHAQLTSQASSNDGFGPSFAEPTTKYDVSANFKLESDAKAYACQPGHIIVTDFFDVVSRVLDPNLVNVILKPTVGHGITFPTVKYYIYRGIKRDSFFTNGKFNAKGPSNSDTVRKMWEDWNANVASSPPPIVPADLGFDAALVGTVHIEEVFGNSHAPLRARQVSEGEWIGTFGFNKKICFEVIVEAELLNLNLEYARKSKVQIDISAMTAIANPTPAQAHTLRCEKEKILAYVDPAALFGMHFSVGVSGASLATAQKRDDLATNFLSKFSTANRVYLDIRSDKGYSYNFYGNYGGGAANPNLIKIKPGAAATFVDDVYLNQGWPLFSQSGWTGPAAKVNLGLRLRIDDNTEPLLFVEDTGHLPGGSKNFLGQTKLKDGAAVDWSKAINLKLDGSGEAGAKVCVATHVRLQYLKQKAGAMVNPRLLQFNHRLDTVFGGIDLPIIGSVGTFRELRNEKVGLAEGADFAHVPETGMYFDPDVVLLYGSSKIAHRTNPNSYPTIDFSTSTLDNVVRSPVFPHDIVFSRWSIVEGGITIRVIDLSLYNQGATKMSVDGIHFLGLKRDELTRLQATAGFGPVHQRFLVFAEDADQLDDNGFPYKKYEVKVQGLDPTGQRRVVAPNPTVFVFGSGRNIFCSKDFANFVNLPDVPPDPGMMKPWEHVFAGTYHSGRVTVNDIGNNPQISNPTVTLQARYFFPLDAAPPAPPAVPAISARKPSYPLVVIVHGNGHLFDEYEALGQHLASNGFIVASINLLITVESNKLTSTGAPKMFFFEFRGLTVVYEHDSVTPKVSIDKWDGTGLHLQPWTRGVDYRIDLVGGIPDRFTFLKSHAPEIQGMASRGRANVLFKHLEVLKLKFGAQVADSIGLIGHSRGGEAVVRAADLIGASSAPADLRSIKAIISLAPTDLWEQEDLTQDIPYFVLYGSRDMDVSGAASPKRAHLPSGPPDIPAGSGGFSLYDRAVNGTVKSMSFVYGATHNGFITKNKDLDTSIDNSCRAVVNPAACRTALRALWSPGIISPAIQNRITLAYMNAFLRQHLLGEEIWKSYFTGQFIPKSTGYHKIYQQYKEMIPGNARMIDDFENPPHEFALSSSGHSVVHSRGGTGLDENFLNPHALLDVGSPHETHGLKVTGWAAADTLTFRMAAGGWNVTGWTHFSFRITQVARKINSSIDTMRVAIVDANTPSHRHEMVLSRSVPTPDFRPDDPTLTKSAFMTIRIPLADYSAHGVDLTKVKSVELMFPSAGSGNIEIDDLEFTK